jgi:hypothetical protein
MGQSACAGVFDKGNPAQFTAEALRAVSPTIAHRWL